MLAFPYPKRRFFGPQRITYLIARDGEIQNLKMTYRQNSAAYISEVAGWSPISVKSPMADLNLEVDILEIEIIKIQITFKIIVTATLTIIFPF